jgi:hypothetical protein
MYALIHNNKKENEPHLNTQWKRSKEDYKSFPRHTNKNSISHVRTY